MSGMGERDHLAVPFSSQFENALSNQDSATSWFIGEKLGGYPIVSLILGEVRRILRVSIEQTQQLQLTPEMLQGISIMSMTALELRGFISKGADNPFLLAKEPATPHYSTFTATRRAPSVREDGLPEGFAFYNAADAPESMDAAIMRQLSMELRNKLDQRIAAKLIAGLDDQGYLRLDTDIVAYEVNTTPNRVEWVLKRMQTCCTPAGIGARSVQERLLSQLEARGSVSPFMRAIVEDHLEDIAAGRISKIAKALHAHEEDVRDAFAEIRTLDPYPADAFATSSIPSIPEIRFSKQDGTWVVEAVAEAIPSLMLDDELVDGMEMRRVREEDLSKMRSELRRAKGIIRAVDLRRASALSIAAAIAELQAPFMEEGVSQLRPMAMADIADRCQISESTVSRVANSVYAVTPHGVLPLRFFFTSRVSGAAAYDEVSSASVKDAIRKLVDAEDPASPLSDAALVDELREQGMDVSRRTVNKYRTALGIPSRAKRRR